MLIDTSKAVEYYVTQHGFTTTIKTLESYRTRGGGPQFIKVGRKVFYTTELLDKWIAERSQLVTNTSQVVK